MTIRPVFAWYDWWVGGFWDRSNRRLFLMVPFVGVMLHFHRWVTCSTPPLAGLPPCPYRKCSGCRKSRGEHYLFAGGV